MIVGQIEIQMLANMARLQADMDLAKRTVGGAMEYIDRTVGAAKTALMGLGAGLGVAAFSRWMQGAIDAGDETNKLAQKIGVTTEEVAGMQLAFRQAGVGDAFASSMAKMSKAVAEGSDAFKAMGIHTRDTDGTLRSSRVLLGEVADKFAGYADGAAKSALAQAVFGKSGADLIPLLNAGSQALDEYDAMAAKLGLTIGEDTAKQAEKFNDTLDLIGQGSQGVARQMAAQLLPTLSGLADQFFTSMSSGDKLKNTADFLASSMKVLYIAGIAVVEVFSTVGKTLAAAGAQMVAMASLDFAGAVAIGKEWAADVGTGWKETLKQIEGAWNATGSAAVESMAATQKAIKGTAPLLDDLKAKTNANADAVKEARRLAAEIAKQNTKEVDALFDAQEKLRLANEDQIKTARTMLDQIEFETRLLDLNAEARAIATLERELETKGIVKGTQAYDAYIAKLREAMSIKTGKEASIKAADDMRQAQQKAAEESSKYWEDALMRAFESGKGFFQSLWDTIKNTLKTQVLKVAIQAATGSTQLGQLSGGSNSLGGLSNMGNSPLTSILNNRGMQGSLDWMMTSQNDAIASLGSGLDGLNQSLNSMGGLSGALGYAKAAYDLTQGNVGSALGTAIGTYFGGPIGAAIGSALGGALDGPSFISTAGTGEASRTFNAAGLATGMTEYAPYGGMSAGASSTIAALQAAYAAQATALGIGTVGTSFGYGGNTGREGASPNFRLTSSAGGVSYTGAETAVSDAALALEASRAVFAALQGSDLPAYLSKVFDGITASTATQADINSALAYAGSLKQIRDALIETRDPLAILQANVDAAFASLGTSAETFKTDFVRAIDAGLSPQNLTAWQTLGANIDSVSASAHAASKSIKALTDKISLSVSDSLYGMQYGMADNSGKYNMLDAKAAGINDKMLGSTDINTIAELAASQIALINQSWALLDPTQQQATYLQFEDKLNKIDEYVISQGADTVGLKAASDKATADAIAVAVEAAVAKAMASSATAMQAAADKADKPVVVESHITVTAPAGSEVSIG